VPRPKLTLPPAEKPRLGLPDALGAAQEEARLAKEGAHKLGRAVEALRTGLETIVSAEWDHSAVRAPTAIELRQIAANTLDAYSAMVGQNWKRNPLIGDRSGDRDLKTLGG
jgi:hypothetical protein